MDYFYIHSGSLEACTVERTRFDYAQFSSCTQCHSASNLSGPVELHIQNTRLSRCPIQCVQQFPDVGVISQDFASALPQSAAARCLVLGTVYGGSGKRMDRWHTFHSPFATTVRGTKNVSFRICSECGRTLYYAAGDRHLCPPPPENVPIFHAGYGTLVVNDDVLNAIDGFVKGKVYATPLGVYEEPLDGAPKVL